LISGSGVFYPNSGNLSSAATKAEISAFASRGFSIYSSSFFFFFFFFFCFTNTDPSPPSSTSSASKIGIRIVVPFMVGKLLIVVAGNLSSAKKF